MFVKIENLLREGERPWEFTRRVKKSAEVGDAFRTFASQFATREQKQDARTWLLINHIIDERREALRRKGKPHPSHF